VGGTAHTTGDKVVKMFKRPAWTGDNNVYTYKEALGFVMAERCSNGITEHLEERIARLENIIVALLTGEGAAEILQYHFEEIDL
jgi:O-acetylhomoserine/O-acetylserine sulfhydrylase-like pyridoxal-dependent enzyme